MLNSICSVRDFVCDQTNWIFHWIGVAFFLVLFCVLIFIERVVVYEPPIEPVDTSTCTLSGYRSKSQAEATCGTKTFSIDVDTDFNNKLLRIATGKARWNFNCKQDEAGYLHCDLQ